MNEIHNKFKDLIEAVENQLYKKVFKNEVNLKVFTYEDALTFFVREKRKVYGAKKCLIAVDSERKFKNNEKLDMNNKLVIRQILLDEGENPIYKTENSYYGRMLTVDELDNELIDYMGGKNKKIMELEV